MAIGKRDSKKALQKVLGKGGNVNAANPLEVHDPKVGSLISYEGTTTADGAGDGSSLTDSVLTTKPNYDGHWVVITSGPYFGQCSDITAATTGGTVTAHEAFDGQILRGTKFVILAMKALPAEVAALTALVIALMADVGDPTGETLGSLADKWGDIARSLDLILGARWDAGGDLGTDIAAIITALATIAGYLDTEIAAIETKLDDETSGLAALKDLIDAIEAKLDHETTGLSALKDLIDAIEAKVDKTLFSMDFWSLPQEEVAIPAAPAADQPLPSVDVADLPTNATIVRAIAMFKFRMVENSNEAANKLAGAQEIQIAGSVDAINFVDDQFTIAATTREGGDVIIGAIDIHTTVTADGTYAFHWDLAVADVASLLFNDVQMGIRIYYSI